MTVTLCTGRFRKKYSWQFNRQDVCGVKCIVSTRMKIDEYSLAFMYAYDYSVLVHLKCPCVAKIYSTKLPSHFWLTL